jgi:dihydrofolate reductase
MSIVRVSAFSISLDGFGAGPAQSEKDPLGIRGEELHPWLLQSRTFKRMYGGKGGSTGVDDGFAARSMEGLGAWIMGRNMFGPVRGPWPDEQWRGWWGETPPYHVPVFVLTHHARPPLEMEGGTVFHFVTGGIYVALQRAREAAGDRDIRIGGGVATVRQYLEARLIDELHLAVTPVLLGKGEHLLGGLDLPALGYTCTGHTAGKHAAHVTIEKGAKAWR